MNESGLSALLVLPRDIVYTSYESATVYCVVLLSHFVP